MLPDTTGYVVCLQIYNKGKDKETKVEVAFPNSSLCQILASNYIGVSIGDNKILVDRILPRQTVILTVYIDSTAPISSASKPSIKSEDANGKAYKGRGNVPPSLGPAVMGISIMSALLITFMYVMLSGFNIFYPYYALRYSAVMAQGITPTGYSDNLLISNSSIGSNSPITVSDPYIDGSQIVIAVKIKNVSPNKIKATINHNLDNKEYKNEIERSDAETPDFGKRVQAWKLIKEKYGFSSKDQLFFSDLIIAPGEEKTVLLAHTVITSTTLDNFNFDINIERGAYENESFRDYYEFNVKDYSKLRKLQELLDSLKH